MSVSNEVGCVQEAWEQGRLFCKVGFCVSALCALQMCQNVRRLLKFLSTYEQRGVVERVSANDKCLYCAQLKALPCRAALM